MTAATQTPKAARKPTPRTLRVCVPPVDGRFAIVTLTVGKTDTGDYWFSAFDAVGGLGFEVQEIGNELEDPYHAFVASDASGLSDSCDCRGFLRHGKCKHSGAARKLVEIRVF